MSHYFCLSDAFFSQTSSDYERLVPTIALTTVLAVVVGLGIYFRYPLQGLWQSITHNKNGTTIRERFKKQGLNTVLLYALLSSMCAVSFMVFGWYGFSLQQGQSPLYPGQWKPFLAVLTGIMAADNALKPARLAIAIGLAPQSDRVMSWIQDKTQSRKMAVVVGLILICVVTLGLLFGGIAVATFMSNVPIFAPQDA